MSKSLKWSALALVIILMGVMLSHGVVVPRFLWEARLTSLQNQYPGQRIEIKRVVLALPLKPQLMITEMEIDDPSRQESVKLALLKVGVDALESIKQGRLQINALTLKGLSVATEKKADCSTFNLDCMPVLPLALAARAWESTQVANPGWFTAQLALNKIEIEQAFFSVTNTEAQQQVTGKLEQFNFQLGKGQIDQRFNLGWQLSIKTPEIDNQLYVSMNAQPEIGPVREVALKKLKVDVDGRWGGFPWTATAEQDLLVLRIRQANSGEGAPFIQLNGENLRTYVRRDDLPETHQAAFSAQQFEGGLPAQDWVLRKAEWTYTHEDAQAWTFNLAYDAAKAELSISPETIEGSEGIAAQAQTRELNCDSSARNARDTKPYWAWQEGWFRVLNDYPKGKASIVICPAQQPSEAGGLAATPASPAGK